MASWLDNVAKGFARSAAVHEDAVASGLTRRQALLGGAVATGVAWTAPALLATQPAWAVASCTGNAPRCANAGGTGTNGCCPPPVNNVQYTCNTSTGFCVAPGELGGNCKNEGSGAGGCRVNSTKCNNATPNICGGPGSSCETNADCVSNNCAPSGNKLVCT